MSKSKKKAPSSLVWFNVPATDVKRAQKFYSGLFGWKIKAFRGMKDFLHIDTGGPDASPDGGLGQRQGEHEGVVNYIGVPSIDKFSAKVLKLGGKVVMPKTAVPEMGYFAVCTDSENNTFGLWEKDHKAK